MYVTITSLGQLRFYNRQPGNAEAAYRLGTALLQRGKAQEARAELQRADNLQPDMPETLPPSRRKRRWRRRPILDSPAFIANKVRPRRHNMKCRNSKDYRVRHRRDQTERAVLRPRLLGSQVTDYVGRWILVCC